MIKDDKYNEAEDKGPESIKRDKHGHLSKQQKKMLKLVLSIFMILTLIAAWFFISFKGIELGKMYIDDAMAEMEANLSLKNSMNYQELMVENVVLNEDIKKLNTEIEDFKLEVIALNQAIEIFSLEVQTLKSSIDFIDTSVATSITVQQDIGNKIQALETRIQELKNSLNILLEAP